MPVAPLDDKLRIKMSRRFMALLIAFSVLLLLAVLSFYDPVEARQVNSPYQQQATEYPYPGAGTLEATLPNPYPGVGTATVAPTASTGVPSATSPLQISSTPGAGTGTLTASPGYAFSPTAPVTPGRDLFGTENAEMGGARVTPPPSETPVPTLTGTPTNTSTATLAVADAFTFNRTWFLTGIFIPIGLLLVGWLVIRASKSGEFR